MGIEQETFGIGMVGCGTISGTHAEAINNLEHGKLVAAFSRNQERVDAFCDRHGGTGFSDYEAFLSHPDLDVVAICTPTGTHLDYGRQAARAGKHLIVEKPVEITLERGQALIDACRESDVQLAVIYQSRFMDDVVRMKQTIDEGKLGRIFMIDASVKWFRDQDYYDNGGWRGTLDLDGGGAVINQAIHTVDLMVWLCGEPERLHALKGTFTHERMEGEDNAVASLRFKNGALGLFSASTSMVPSRNRKIEVHGTKGTAVLDGDVFRFESGGRGSADVSDKRGAGSSNPLAGMTASHHARQYEQILNALRNNEQPAVSGAESLKSLAVVEAIYDSAGEGKVVKLSSTASGEEL